MIIYHYYYCVRPYITFMVITSLCKTRRNAEHDKKTIHLTLKYSSYTIEVNYTKLNLAIVTEN